MKHLFRAAVYLALTSFACLAAQHFTIPFKQYKLKNGMRVILSEDHSAPTLAVAVCYDAGSRDEKPGQTGFAHFFEHLMFGESKNNPGRELGNLIGGFGGTGAGTTTQDRTFYWNTLPANQLDLGLFYEADRMHSLVFSNSFLAVQRDSVREERRLRVDNHPYGKTNETIYDTAYDSFPYKHPVIGTMTDLNAAKMEDFQAFYQQYYAPNNATLVIVGDFRKEEALAKARKYFEAIPSRPMPPRPGFTEKPQTSERRKTVESPFAQQPRIDLVFKIPPGNSPDYYPIMAMNRILATGDSSRLWKRLGLEADLVSGVYSDAIRCRGPGLAWITLNPRTERDIAAIEKSAYQEITQMQNHPVTDGELEMARTAARRAHVTSNVSFLGRASRLAEAAVVLGDANLVNAEPRKMAKVTKEDIMRVARKYFTEANRTVVITLMRSN